MPITIPNTMLEEAERPHSDQQWIWLLELEAERFTGENTPVLFRLTNYHQDLVWPVGASPEQRWYPFPFTFSDIEESGEGDLPQLEVAVDNATRMLMPLLHAQNGFEGNRARLVMVQEKGKDIATPNEEGLEYLLNILTAVANDDSVNLRMEVKNYFQVRTPSDRYTASLCRWLPEFGGENCGYIVNSGAAFSTCGGTIEDCVARGADEAARGLPVLHPERWGAFPGIPKQRRL